MSVTLKKNTLETFFKNCYNLKHNKKKGGEAVPEELKSLACGKPTGASVGEEPKENQKEDEKKEEVKSMVKIGKKAPDFVAPAYYQGKFVNVKLSEYLGKWVLLCFYPADFTFV